MRFLIKGDNPGEVGFLLRWLGVDQITYADFDDYWNANTGFLSPVATAVKALDEDKRQQIKRIVRANLPVDDHGAVSYAARVNAVRGSV